MYFITMNNYMPDQFASMSDLSMTKIGSPRFIVALLTMKSFSSI